MAPRVRKGRQTLPREGSTTTTATTTTEAKIQTPKTILKSDPAKARVALLPNNLSPKARIHTLTDPASLRKSRFLVCPVNGFYRIVRTTPGHNEPRSWMVTDESEAEKAEISSWGDLLIASPYDPVFFLTPVLLSQSTSRQSNLFLEAGDLLDRLVDADNGWSPILRDDSLSTRIEGRLSTLCDTTTAGSITMYRLSFEKLRETFLSKAKRATESGLLPLSLEAKFVKHALERPLTVQSRTSSAAAATVALPPADEALTSLLRTRVAIDFVLSHFEPATRALVADHLLGPTSPIDFSPLDTYTSQLQRMREAARESKAIAATFAGGYKRSADEINDARAEKKRKKDGEDKAKKSVSRGVKSLQKANVGGMKKMSDFFKKVA